MRATALLSLLVCATSGAQTTFDPPFHDLSFRMLNTSADPFRYYLDGRSGYPATVLPGQVQAAVDSAFQTWEDVACAYPDFTSLGVHTNNPQIADPRDAFDTFNVTAIWVTSPSDPYYDFALAGGGAAAAAVPLSYAGTLYQCDIYLNAVDFSWSTNPGPTSNHVDVQSLVLHEIGHCMGLGHSTWHEDVMYPSYPVGNLRRALATRDVQKACDLLPQTGAVGSPCLADGGCGSASLHCVEPPLTDGGTGAPFCSKGCDPGIPMSCDAPFVCKASNLIDGSPGTCLSSTGDHVTQVGRPCTQAKECGSPVGLCQGEGVLPSGSVAWQDGYCTQDCGPGRPACPVESTCVDFGSGVYRCIETCRLGSGDCRFGYACVPATSEVNLCWPACGSDADCDDGTGSYLCRTCDGTCVARQSPTGQIGDACTQNAQCGTGHVCLMFEGRSVGVCSQPCAHACTACPTGTTCHPMQSGDLFCLRDCTAGTCEAGQTCGLLASGRGCMPGCTSNEHCAVGTWCVAGECVNPYEDAGCTLCPDRPDAGLPQLPDAGQGGSSSGGCGCSSTMTAAWPLALLLIAAGRRRCWKDGR